MGELRAFVAMSVKPDALDHLRETVASIVEDAAGEVGVRELSYAADESKSRILVQERYADAGAMLAHLGAMNQQAVQRLVGLVTIERMDVVGATTPELRQALAGFGSVTYFEPLLP